MKTEGIAVAKVALIVVTAAMLTGAIAWFLHSQQTIAVERPEWMRLRPEQHNPPPPDAVRVNVTPETPIADMAPPARISKALQDAKQEVTFHASTILEANLSEHVAHEIVTATEQHWQLYQTLQTASPDNSMLPKMAYFFALWPDLPRNLASKRVQMRVAPAPRGRDIGAGSITYAFLQKERQLMFAFHLPHWQVQMTVPNSDELLPQLHAEIERASLAAMEQAGK